MTWAITCCFDFFIYFSIYLIKIIRTRICYLILIFYEIFVLNVQIYIFYLIYFVICEFFFTFAQYEELSL